jgi:DMSO/TMAO reductase YedYZ molybdopterin-dependent catalytic subunit
MRINWPAALAGVAAAGLGLATAELVAALLNRGATPVLAVGEAVIERSPGWLTDWAIGLFGTSNKAVLTGGVLVVLAGLAAGAGLLAARRRGAGLALAAALGAIAALAVWARPDSTEYDLLPVILGGGAAVIALDRLAVRLPTVPRVAPDRSAEPAVPGGPPPEPSGASPESVAHPLATADRRTFVRGAAAVAGLAVFAGGAARWLGSQRRGVETSREVLAEPAALPRQLPPADPPGGADLGVVGAQPWRTPNAEFYRIDTALAVPLVHPDEWQLRIHGMVEQEVVLGFDELVDLGLVDRWVTLCCVSNPVGGDLVGNAFWTGVPVGTVLALAGPAADADAVLSTSHDGWTCGTPLDVLTDGRDSLFAVAMNGEPLPVDHGFPVRMVVPGLYGYVSATKWVVDLEVSRFDLVTAYWTSRGWAERGPVKVSSRIDVPAQGSAVAAGTVPVAGVAWAQHRGIEAVEVRVDGGSWQLADLAEVPSADTWRQWVWQWDATPGRHRLEVRAVTADGETQTGETAPPAPDGATGWHAIDVEVDG